MLNQFADFRIVVSKICEALDYKYRSIAPCPAHAWKNYLKELGIESDFYGDQHRRGFLRVSDPMCSYVLSASGDAVGKRYDTLYIPEDLAEKILVLGGLP